MIYTLELIAAFDAEVEADDKEDAMAQSLELIAEMTNGLPTGLTMHEMLVQGKVRG